MMVDLDLLQRAQAVIDAGFDFEHVEMALEQRDGRQEAVALQAIRVEAIGRVVRGHDEDDPLGEQPVEQPPENHRVGDVGNMEFVKAEQAHLAGDLPGDLEHRVGLALVFFQVVVNLLHEGVEVDAPLAPVGHRIVEAVHQEALAAPDPAPEIDAARRRAGGASRRLKVLLRLTLNASRFP